LLQSNKITLLNISQAVSVFTLIACGYQVYELVEKGNLKLLEGKNLYELHGLFGHKNLFSSIMFLCLPFLVYLIIHTKNKIRYLYIVLIISTLILLVFIQTKAVLLALLLGIGVAMLVLFSQLKISSTIKYSSFAMMIFGVLIGVFLLKNKLTLLSNNDTIVERTLLWQNTWQMIKEHPLMGVGAGNWQLFFPKYGLHHFMQTNYLISDGYTTFQRPHNDFLWIWSELGILGLLVYISIFSFAIYYAIKNIKAAINTENKITEAAFLMAVVGYVFIALVDFPLERSEHQFFVTILLSITYTEYYKNKITLNLNSKTVFIAIIVISIFNLNVFFNRVSAETHAHNMLVAHRKANWNLMLKEAKKAQNSYYTIDNFSIPLPWYAGVAYSALGNNAEAKKDFEEAYQINPYQIHVLNNIASINEMEGNHDLAINYYNEALAISPTQPDALLNKSAVFFNKGNVNEAFTSILKFKFDAKNSQFTNYYLTISKAKLNNDLADKKISRHFPNLNLQNIENDTFLLNNFEEIKKFYLNLY
jgi:tetratricopeptide (TPR) repeat protein